MAVKVLVVDDSAFFRRRVVEFISSDPSLTVVGEAVDGREAVAKTLSLKPDVITMDIEMPNMNGIDAVREIMQKQPTPILMFSSLTYEGADATFKALEAGAVDFLLKDFGGVAQKREDNVKELLNNIKSVARSPAFRRARASVAARPAASSSRLR